MKRSFLCLLAVLLISLLASAAGALAEAGVLALPSNLKVVKSEAFYGNQSLDEVVLPESVERIEALAFAGSSVNAINLPDSLVFIAEDAFSGTPLTSVSANAGCYAYDWAVDHGYIIPDIYPESAHPYANDSDETWTWEGPSDAVALRIRFSSETLFESGYDFLRITSNAGFVKSYTGERLSGAEIILPGNALTFNLTSDEIEQEYGFRILAISAVSQAQYDRYVADHLYDYSLRGDGTIEITSLNAPVSGDLEFPAEIDGYKVSGIGYQAFMGNTDITGVVIPEGVTIIRSSAFSGCVNLSRAVVPGTVEEIDSEAFLNCQSLTDLSLGEGIKHISWSAFENCTSLTKVTLPDSLEDISNSAFDRRDNLTVHANKHTYAYTWAVERGYIQPEGTLDILPYVYDGDITEDGDVLYWDHLSGNDDELRILIHTDGETTVASSTEWLGIWGSENSQMTLTAGNQRVWLNPTKNLTGGAREGRVVITCGDVTKTVVIRQLPYLIPELIAPSALAGHCRWPLDDNTEIAFPYEALTLTWRTVDGAVDYRIGLDTPKVYMGSDGVEDLFGATAEEAARNGGRIEVNIGEYLAPTARRDHWVFMWAYDAYGHRYSSEYAFSVYDEACPEWGYELVTDDETGETRVAIAGYRGSASDVTIPTELLGYPVYRVAHQAFTNNTTIRRVVVPEGVTSIDYNAFEYCKNLTEVVLPESLTVIGSGAFEECENLKDITLPQGLMSIGEEAFFYCTALEHIVIPEGVTCIEWDTFLGCTSLKNVVLPQGLTYIGNYAFCNCAALESIVIPEGVTRIASDAFSGCTSLKDVVLPQGLTYIGNYAFCNCAALEGIVIPEGVTRIESGTFYGCTSLKDIVLPQGLTYISSNAFFNCAELESIVIPEGVTRIVSYTFCGCTRLRDVALPKGLTSISNNAFYYCTALESIVIPGNVSYIAEYAFEDCVNLAITPRNDYVYDWALDHGFIR